MALDILPGSEFFTFMTSVNNAFTALFNGATPEQKAYFIQAFIDDRDAARRFFHLPPTVVSPETLAAVKAAAVAAQTVITSPSVPPAA